MKEGVEFPPLVVVFDGANYWLVDGFQRRWAAIKSKLPKFKCEVIEGTLDDARWLSYAANKTHGLARTNEDKKNAVIAALKHPTGAKKSNEQIAEHVGVSSAMVGKYRKQLASTLNGLESTSREGRDGRTIDTTNIGKSKPEVEEEVDDEEPSEGSEPSGGAVESQATEAAPVSIPEDSAGQPIPKALREVFDRSKEFDAHARTLTAIQQWAEKIGAELPGKWLHVQSFRADLNNAKQALRHNKPYAVCPYCQAKKPKCEACKGVGFVSKRIYDGAPQELRA